MKQVNTLTDRGRGLNLIMLGYDFYLDTTSSSSAAAAVAESGVQ